MKVRQVLSEKTRTKQDIVEDVVSAARKIFPNAETDLEAACLMASYLRGAVSERDSLLNINARQAGLMAVAYVEADQAKRELAELKASVSPPRL